MFLLRRVLLLIIPLCGLGLMSSAQVFTIKGIVCTKGSTSRIAKASVTNKKTNKIAFSDDFGVFTIQASEGDTLETFKPDFATDIQVVKGPASLIVFLQSVVHLDQVTIRSQTKQQEMQEYLDDYRKKGIYGGGKTSVGAAITHPINALYDLFGKGPAQARRFAELTKQEEAASFDHRKYNKALVKRITNLPDDKIQGFMDAYTPSHDDLLKWSDYELINYIKLSYESYKQVGPTKGLQRLSTPPGVKKP